MFKTSGKITDHYRVNLYTIDQFHKGNPKHVNMQPVGLIYSHPGCDVFGRVGCILGSFYNWILNLCPPPKKKQKKLNWLDLETLGSRPIMPKHLPKHWGADHTGQSRHHPSASLVVVVWKVVGLHLFLNMIPAISLLKPTGRTGSLEWVSEWVGSYGHGKLMA